MRTIVGDFESGDGVNRRDYFVGIQPLACVAGYRESGDWSRGV